MNPDKYRDYLSHVRVQDLEHGMFHMVDQQSLARSPQHGYAEMACLFYIQTQILGIDLSQTISSLAQAVNDINALDTEKFRAIRAYIEGEM